MDQQLVNLPFFSFGKRCFILLLCNVTSTVIFICMQQFYSFLLLTRNDLEDLVISEQKSIVRLFFLCNMHSTSSSILAVIFSLQTRAASSVCLYWIIPVLYMCGCAKLFCPWNYAVILWAGVFSFWHFFLCLSKSKSSMGRISNGNGWY